MCGIVAYVGPRQAHEIIIKGLKRLEYRGYDSAGIALLNGSLNVYKKKGKVTELEESLKGQNLNSHIGMGHTRWATHGEPNDVNAHPHYSATKKIAIIHNGIMKNSPLPTPTTSGLPFRAAINRSGSSSDITTIA